MPIPRDKREIIQGWPKYIATFGPEMNWEQALRVEDFTDVSRPPLTSASLPFSERMEGQWPDGAR